MKREIAKYVSECDTCQRIKASHLKTELFEIVTISSRGFTSLLLCSYTLLVWYYGAQSHARLGLLIFRPL
jgi:hypothetical protein